MLKPYVDENGEARDNFAARFRKAYNIAFNALLHHYKNGVLFFIRRRWAMWVTLATGLTALVFLMKSTPTGLVPDEDVASLMISLDTKPGSSLKETDRIMQTIDKKRDIHSPVPAHQWACISSN